jgi:hypothetical protein
VLIDVVSPRWHHRERHDVPVSAPAADVLDAIEALRWSEVPLFRTLMTVRGLGTRLPADRPILDSMVALGFAELARSADELVYGAVGRPWSPGGGLIPVTGAAEFAAVADPGWAKMATNFVIADGRLVTETRVWLTSAGARRRFRPYWLVVRPFSGLIRRSWLRAIRARTASS